MEKLIERMLVVAVVIASLVAICSVVNSHAQHNEWVETRTVETIRVAPNETMWQIAEQYKPDFMDTREYIYEVKTLNNMSDTYLYVGDKLLVYTDNNITHYTMSGVYQDGTIVTNDGNEWYCDAEFNDNTSVVVTFSDNNTPNNIYDDAIINITKE
jgi:hypothetical protein